MFLWLDKIRLVSRGRGCTKCRSSHRSRVRSRFIWLSATNSPFVPSGEDHGYCPGVSVLLPPAPLTCSFLCVSVGVAAAGWHTWGWSTRHPPALSTCLSTTSAIDCCVLVTWECCYFLLFIFFYHKTVEYCPNTLVTVGGGWILNAVSHSGEVCLVLGFLSREFPVFFLGDHFFFFRSALVD